MKNKKLIITITILVILGLIVNYYLDKRNERLMSKNTDTTIGVYDGFIVVRNTGPKSYFYYFIKDKKMLTSEPGKFNFLQKGDTVLIKYSIEDPSVAEVIDYCYMQKHKGKSYCK